MTFEVTYLIKTKDGSEIDLSELEMVLSYYDSEELELVELDFVEPDTAGAVFSAEVDSIQECPRRLKILNDSEIVEDVDMFTSSRVSYTEY